MIKLFLDDLTTKATLPEHANYNETVEKNHGRIEIRRCWVSTRLEWLMQKKDWRDLSMIGVVESERHEGDKVTLERRYFISSLTCSAMKFMESVRAHWSVENCLHWSLDIGFREDESRIRKDHGPENMAIFRQMSLNMLKQEKTEKTGIYNKRLLAASSDEYLELLLQGQI